MRHWLLIGGILVVGVIIFVLIQGGTGNVGFAGIGSTLFFIAAGNYLRIRAKHLAEARVLCSECSKVLKKSTGKYSREGGVFCGECFAATGEICGRCWAEFSEQDEKHHAYADTFLCDSCFKETTK